MWRIVMLTKFLDKIPKMVLFEILFDLGRANMVFYDRKHEIKVEFHPTPSPNSTARLLFKT